MAAIVDAELRFDETWAQHDERFRFAGPPLLECRSRQ